MKKLTKDEAAQISTKPNGRMNRTRLHLITMEPGDIILLERSDWTQRTQVPHTLHATWPENETAMDLLNDR